MDGDVVNSLARALVGIVASVVFGVTLWYAFYGDLRAHLGIVALGTAIVIAAVFVGCVVLEPDKERNYDK